MSRITSPVFVGRGPELELLTDLLRAPADRATAALIGGDAGIGKTRLVSEFAALAEAEGAAVLVGECLEFSGAALPYAPMAEAVERFVRTAPESEVVEGLVDLAGFLSGRAGSLGAG